MNEMYWITRLDTLCIVSAILFFISLVGLIITFADYCIKRDVYGGDSEDAKISKKWIKPFLIMLLSVLPFVLFVPSEKDMYKIIGIGGTYDYLKQNNMEKKTCFVKEDSIELFEKNLVVTDKVEIQKSLLNFNYLLIGEKSWRLPKEFIYPKKLLKGFDAVCFEISDKTEIAKVEIISRFTYLIEPYDDISVKLVLDSTNSERA